MVEFGTSSMHRWLHCYWRRVHPVPFLDVLLLLILIRDLEAVVEVTPRVGSSANVGNV